MRVCQGFFPGPALRNSSTSCVSRLRLTLATVAKNEMEGLPPLRIRRALTTDEEAAGPVGFGQPGCVPPARTAILMALGPGSEASDAWGEKEARMRLELRVRSFKCEMQRARLFHPDRVLWPASVRPFVEDFLPLP